MIKNIFLALVLFASPSSHNNDEFYLKEEKIYPLAASGLKRSYLSSVVVFSASEDEILGSGSGNYFSFKKERFILTAAHVVQDSEKIFIGERNTNIVEAEILFIDKDSDIAMLRTKESLTSTKAVRFQTKRQQYIGESIYHTGHPDGETWHVSKGMLSSTQGSTIIGNTFAWPGSSGSVVFDKSGNVIGVISAIKISSPLGLPDMVEHIVLISNINNILK
jgi:S1-C subfamily serine protease